MLRTLIRFNVVKVDLDVDSDNNGKIEDADDSVEDSKEFLFWLNQPSDRNNYLIDGAVVRQRICGWTSGSDFRPFPQKTPFFGKN